MATKRKPTNAEGYLTMYRQMVRIRAFEAEVIYPRTIVPLDEATIVDSVRKTSRAIVVDEGHQSDGMTGEIAARIAEKAFYHLDAPVLRMGAMEAPVPTAEHPAEQAGEICRREI